MTHGLRLMEESETGLMWDPPLPAMEDGAQEREIAVRAVGTFTVTDGHRVSVVRAEGAETAEVQAILDGKVTAALLQQRRILPLHLAAVVVKGRAFGFVGPPGAGKSSLACALADRGHTLLTDDLGAVGYDDAGRPRLHPGPPVMRIWGSSARQLGWPADDTHRITAGVDKFAYDLPERFADRPTRLAAVYALVPVPGEHLIEPVRGFQKFETFSSGATYNREFLDTAAARAWHFAEVCRIADQLPAFALRVPDGGPALKSLAIEVERHAALLPPGRG